LREAFGVGRVGFDVKARDLDLVAVDDQGGRDTGVVGAPPTCGILNAQADEHQIEHP
jgi:hypothetical protein